MWRGCWASWITQFVEMKDTWIAEKINFCTLVSPDGTKLDVPFANETGYILNRRILITIYRE